MKHLRRLHLALITPGFSASEEDWCIPVLRSLVQGLALEVDVEVFALRYPHRRGSYRAFGAQVHAIGGAACRGLRRVPMAARALAALGSAARQRPFDVVHGLWAHEPGYLAVVAGRRLGMPAVVSVLGGELVALRDIGYGGQLTVVGRWLTRRALHGADRVTAGSAVVVAEAARRAPPSSTPTVVPLGVDEVLFQPQPGGEQRLVLAGDPILLHVASLVPVKDQATLVDAVATVLEHLPNAHLHVVGDGPLRDALSRQASDLGLDLAITFHGELAHDRLPHYYRASDLFVLSSRFESQAMVALEAAACGCPVVGTRVGVVPELGAASRTVEPGNAVALGEAIVNVLRDARTRSAMADAGPEVVRERFLVGRTLAGFKAIYDELVGVEARRG